MYWVGRWPVGMDEAGLGTDRVSEKCVGRVESEAGRARRPRERTRPSPDTCRFWTVLGSQSISWARRSRNEGQLIVAVRCSCRERRKLK